VEGRLTEIVVIPRSAELEAAEEELSHALVAVVGSTRPAVSPAIVRQHLGGYFGITADTFSVRRHALEDFIVSFDRL
jgi:hypothetical protein